MTEKPRAYRSSILHYLDDPEQAVAGQAFEYFHDGVLVIENGRIRQLGPAMALLPTLNLAGIEVVAYENCLLVPGFIDCHVHYPQLEMIASYGEQLLEWLEQYAYPCERQFSDPLYARHMADLFLTELLRHGTTCAAVFSTVHKGSAEALFEAAQKRHMRIMTGKVLMDRNAPDDLLDTPESAYRQSRELIERWHGKGRLSYAVTPRFAPCCSREELLVAQRLLNEFPDIHLQTHLAENPAELAWVNTLFPDCRHYTDVYDRHGLLGERSLFAHAIHLQDEECRRLGETGSSVAFCPSSNLFLGSGVFDRARLESHRIKIGLGSDIGAGTSLSPLGTLQDAYKVAQLRGQPLDPFKALYLATLGGARALGLAAHVGNFKEGREADFVVLDYRATPLLTLRSDRATTLKERLFALIMLGDDRVIRETFIAGKTAHRRGE